MDKQIDSKYTKFIRMHKAIMAKTSITGFSKVNKFIDEIKIDNKVKTDNTEFSVIPISIDEFKRLSSDKKNENAYIVPTSDELPNLSFKMFHENRDLGTLKLIIPLDKEKGMFIQYLSNSTTQDTNENRYSGVGTSFFDFLFKLHKFIDLEGDISTSAVEGAKGFYEKMGMKQDDTNKHKYTLNVSNIKKGLER